MFIIIKLIYSHDVKRNGDKIVHMDVHAPASNNNNNNNYSSSNINNNNINKNKNNNNNNNNNNSRPFLFLHYIFNVLYFAYALTLICLFCITYVLYNNKKILIVKIL